MVDNKSATFASYTALFLFVLTLIGLVWSRAILSIVHILWLAAACVFFVRQKHLFKNNSLLIWSLTPLVLFLLGLYQQPLARGNLDYLLTLSIYPVAAAGTMVLVKNVSIKRCLITWTIVAFASLALPLKSYIQNVSDTYLMYAQARTLNVWMSADHVRYGLFLCSSFLFLISYKFLPCVWQRVLSGVVFVAIVLLSVRTAWVGAAIIISIAAWQNLKQTSYAKYRWFVPLLLIVAALGSYKYIDSVRGKVDYMIYDWQSFDSKKYDPNFSDGARRAINYTAWKAVTAEDNANKGWAAISPTLKSSFTTYFPNQTTEFGWPFNQWLYWWMGAGWWSALLFSTWLFYPLFYGLKKKNYQLVSWSLVIVLSCVVEATLSLQYGVFLHAWVIAMVWSISEYDNS